MSARNKLENKKKRRAEREAHQERVEKNRALEQRIKYLAYAPPDTYEELETEIHKAIEETS